MGFFCLIPLSYFIQPLNLPYLWQLSTCSMYPLSMPLFLFCLSVYFAHWTSHISDIMWWYLPFSDWLISLSIVTSKSILAVSKGTISFLCPTAFFISSSPDGHLGCFQNLAIVNNAPMNTEVHKFFQISVSGFFVYFPRNGIIGSKGSFIFLIFKGNSILFSTVAAPVCIPTYNALGSLFSASSPALVCWFINDSHSDRHEVISYSGFNFYLSGD